MKLMFCKKIAPYKYLAYCKLVPLLKAISAIIALSDMVSVQKIAPISPIRSNRSSALQLCNKTSVQMGSSECRYREQKQIFYEKASLWALQNTTTIFRH